MKIPQPIPGCDTCMKLFHTIVATQRCSDQSGYRTALPQEIIAYEQHLSTHKREPVRPSLFEQWEARVKGGETMRFCGSGREDYDTLHWNGEQFIVINVFSQQYRYDRFDLAFQELLDGSIEF